MKTTPLSIAIVLLGLCTPKALAQDTIPTVDLDEVLTSHKECKVIVYETPQSPLQLNMSELKGTRGFGADLWNAMRSSYVSSATGLIGSVSSDAITSTVGFLTETFRSKKEDWRKMVKKDCTFEMTIPMDEPVKDFYSKNSQRGAMDPEGIIFDGFGCRQVMYITHQEGDSTVSNEIPVIDMRCSLRKDSVGIARLIHHGKFEIVLDYIKVNPYLCNLPNVTLSQEEVDTYIPFDFTKRNNFRLSINAVMKSSWINEAILLNQEETLGKFRIDISIPDSTYLKYEGDGLGYFVYERPGLTGRELTAKEQDYNKKAAAMIKVTGDSFLVPRTFIGRDDNNKGIWGTGMYSLEMSLSETCDINWSYYMDPPAAGKTKQRWNHHWSDEWKMMKQRQDKESPYNTIWKNVKMQYGDNKWVNTIISPATSFILKSESDFVKKHLDQWLQFGKESEK